MLLQNPWLRQAEIGWGRGVRVILEVWGKGDSDPHTCLRTRKPCFSITMGLLTAREQIGQKLALLLLLLLFRACLAEASG